MTPRRGDEESQLEKAPLMQKNGNNTPRPDSHRMSYAETLAGAAYCATSTGMMLVNKAALSSFGFHCPNSLLLFQCIIALVMVLAAHMLRIVTVESLNWPVVKLWLPVNVIFVGMIWTGTMSLKYLGVAMVTVLKNLTNILVIIGDLALFNRRYTTAVWVTLVLMILSALVGAATDLDFNMAGYIWQFFNCCFTAAYSLYLKTVMQAVTALPERHHKPLEEFTMVLYNNILSIPMIIFLVLASGESSRLPLEPALSNPRFLSAATLSGIISFFMSAASLWFLSVSTPTTYSLVGSLNKIPLAVLGMLLFKAPTSALNIASVAVGLVAGTIFVVAKARPVS